LIGRFLAADEKTTLPKSIFAIVLDRSKKKATTRSRNLRKSRVTADKGKFGQVCEEKAKISIIKGRQDCRRRRQEGPAD